MIRFARIATVFVCLMVLMRALPAQHRVDPRNMYERVLAIVPWTGSGTHADPRRPLYAPTPAQMIQPPALPGKLAARSGLLGFQCVESDDRKLALCEFVFANRTALQPILADINVKSFLKGKDKLDDAVAEFKKHKKDFDITRFGVIVR